MSAKAAGDVVEVGISWFTPAWEQARSAYVADLDTDPDAPGSFVGWLDRAIDRHAARSPADRAALAEPDPATSSLPPAKGFKRALLLEVDTATALEDAVVADRVELGRLVTRSQFVREAALAAAAEALHRYGRPLPAPPARLPNRPVRRRDQRLSTS